MAKHKPRKSAPTEYTTDDEDMLMYDVEGELESDPTDNFVLKESPSNFPRGYIRSLTPTRFRKMFVAYPHRPMPLHSLTENSLAVLNHKILEVNSHVQNVKLGGHRTCLSINRLWHELCDMLHRLVGTTASGHHDCSIQE
ncbi:uncharacterized protein TNCV_1159431 [Trichonephila clavipes]|nr:uncharacterized protein TNCV_1159431 [Trichonephila clavipes]